MTRHYHITCDNESGNDVQLADHCWLIGDALVFTDINHDVIAVMRVSDVELLWVQNEPQSSDLPF